MALNGLFCADVPLRNYSLTHPVDIAITTHCCRSVVVVGCRRVDKRGAAADAWRRLTESILQLDGEPGPAAAGCCRVRAVHPHRSHHVLLLHRNTQVDCRLPSVRLQSSNSVPWTIFIYYCPRKRRQYCFQHRR